MDASILSVLAQAPLIVIFVWFTLHRDKLSGAERRERDDSWQTLIQRSEDSQAELAKGQLQILHEIAREHRESQERVMEGQAQLRRGVAKVTALIVAQMTGTGTEEAKKLVGEILED